MVAQEYAAKGFSLSWVSLNLYSEGGCGWQGHHIHPINWEGVDAAGNLQYLPQSQHHPFTTWFSNRKADILRELNKP